MNVLVMKKMETKEFDEILYIFPDRIKKVLSAVSSGVKSCTYEIRLRSGKPIVLFTDSGSNFLKPDSTVSIIDSNHSMLTFKDDLQQIVSCICGYSVYSHQNDIAKGYVTFGNGHRAGFCGTAVINNGDITALRDIDSINIRISRNFNSAADLLLEEISKNSDFNGIIIGGAPCTGKTTVLKSFAEKISSSYKFRYMKTVLVDERFEMFGGCGLNCDVLSGFSKQDGISHAIRVLSPEIIVCDEITSIQEAETIVAGCYSGVKFVVSVHIGAPDDLFVRPVSKKLTDSGFFDYVVFLEKTEKPGNIKEIVNLEELKNGYYRNYCRCV